MVLYWCPIAEPEERLLLAAIFDEVISGHHLGWHMVEEVPLPPQWGTSPCMTSFLVLPFWMKSSKMAELEMTSLGRPDLIRKSGCPSDICSTTPEKSQTLHRHLNHRDFMKVV